MVESTLFHQIKGLADFTRKYYIVTAILCFNVISTTDETKIHRKIFQREKYNKQITKINICKGWSLN